MNPATTSLVLSGGLVVVLSVRLAVRTGARATGGLLACGGAALIATGLLDDPHTVDVASVVAAQFGGLAVLAYPRVPRRDIATWLAALAVCSGIGWVLDMAGPNGLSLAMLTCLLVPLAQVWWRLEAGEPARPLLWMLTVVISVSLLGLLLVFIDQSGRMPWLFALYFPLFALIPVAAAVGVTSPDAIDVRGIASALAVNVAAGVGIFAGYGVIAATWEGASGHPLGAGVGGVVALGCAVLFEPLRRQLRLVSDEVLFGVRPDPLAAMGRVAPGIGDDPESALESVRAALVLPYLAFRMEHLPVVAVGERAEHHRVLPVHLDAEEAGELVVGLRAGDLRLPAADAKVLALAGPLLAQSMRARALADRLQEARQAAAGVREEERLRLRRDLHDGLGPRLSGIAFRADAARLSLGDPEDAADQLSRVRAEAVAAIREIRELVYGMRPPALDEVGLVEALRLQTAGMRTPGGQVLQVSMVAGDVPVLPAAVEVAAYRIVVEALLNAARHSGSESATVRMCADSAVLSVEVRDGGASSGGPAWRPGVGISSMRERAAELGGTVTVGDGTVRAELPLQT